MIDRVQRFLSLHRLQRYDNRLNALEERFTRSQRAIENLQNQNVRLQERLQASQNQVTRLQKRIAGRFEHADEQLDLVKSSLDVSPELVREFQEWRNQNPIPERPFITVAVATYNRAEVLTERCIPSVLGQTYENLELIVVGEGCTDGTEETIAGIDDPRLRFVNLPQRDSYPSDATRRWMVAGTRPTNEALSMAEGDFICHLDDDDEYLPERLKKLVTLAVEEDCDLVWHPYWREDGDGGWELVESRKFVRGQVTNGAVLYRSWFTRIESSVDAYLLREPGDWNRFRQMKYISSSLVRHPDPLLKKYR